MQINTVKNKYHKHKGTALIWVAVVMTVFVGVLSAIIIYYSNGLQQTKAQENTTKAYYLAQSGIEIGIKALTQPLGSFVSGKEDTLLWQYERTATKAPLQQVLTIGDGTVTIQLKRYVDSSGFVWVEVQALGKFVQNGKEFTKKEIVLVSVDNPLNILRK